MDVTLSGSSREALLRDDTHTSKNAIELRRRIGLVAPRVQGRGTRTELQLPKTLVLELDRALERVMPSHPARAALKADRERLEA